MKKSIKYYQGDYPSTHWAKQQLEKTSNAFVGEFKILGHEVLVKVNPTDARGYRCIVSLKDHKDASSTFNRPYSFSEKLAVSIGLVMVDESFVKLGLVAQTEIAGNNSHFMLEDGTVCLGSDKEPSMLHGHIIGRGNPSYEYVEGVELGGPIPGSLFNMRGNGTEEGNQSKLKWDTEKQAKVAYYISEQLQLVCAENDILLEQLGLAGEICLKDYSGIEVYHP